MRCLLVFWAVAITSCCQGDCQQACHSQSALTLHLSSGDHILLLRDSRCRESLVDSSSGDHILLPKQSGIFSIVSGFCRGPGCCSAVGQAAPRTGSACAPTAVISSCWRPGFSAKCAIRFDGSCQHVRWQLPWFRFSAFDEYDYLRFDCGLAFIKAPLPDPKVYKRFDRRVRSHMRRKWKEHCSRSRAVRELNALADEFERHLSEARRVDIEALSLIHI